VLWTPQDQPDYQGVLIFQVILYDEVSFGTSTKCVNYSGVHIRVETNTILRGLSIQFEWSEKIEYTILLLNCLVYAVIFKLITEILLN